MLLSLVKIQIRLIQNCVIPLWAHSAFIFAMTNISKFMTLLIIKPNSETNVVNNYHLHIHLPAATQLQRFMLLEREQR